MHLISNSPVHSTNLEISLKLGFFCSKRRNMLTPREKAPVLCSSFNPNFKQAATGSSDASLMVWNFRQSSRAYRFLGHKDAINDIEFTANGQLIGSASSDRTCRLWIPSVKGTWIFTVFTEKSKFTRTYPISIRSV